MQKVNGFPKYVRNCHIIWTVSNFIKKNSKTIGSYNGIVHMCSKAKIPLQ